MILEGLCTTLNENGTIHLAPMGPMTDDDLTRWTLRPFPTSTTYANLVRTRHCVFHVTDDACLVALAALDLLPSLPATVDVQGFPGRALVDCCRWFALRLRAIDTTGDRPRISCDVVLDQRVREFWGFNRARHALIEAAIVASRLHLIEPTEVRRQLDAWRGPVVKTGGLRELETYELICRWVDQRLTDGWEGGAGI